MSYAPINPEENQQAPTGQTTNVPASQMPPQVSGSVGAGQTSGAPKGATSGSPTQFGSSASKLGDYLSANAPQITSQANTIAGNLNQQYGNLSQGISDTANQFGQQVKGGYAQNNPDLINQALQNPETFVSNPENVKGFQSLYNDAYTGPTSFESTSPYSDIQNQVGQAVQQGNLLSSESGLQSYLQGQGSNPTKASSTLDALLMRGNPEAQQTIQNAAGQLGNLTGQFQTATQNADQAVLDAQNAAAAARDYARQQGGTTANTFNTSLQNAAQQAEAARQAYNLNLAAEQSAANTGRSNLLNAKQTDLQNLLGYASGHGYGDIDQKVLNLFSPSTANYDAILGSTMANTPATLANTATTDQYARANALAQLLGGDYNNPLNQSLIGQAGTYQGPGELPSLSKANQSAAGQQAYMQDLLGYLTGPAGGTPLGELSGNLGPIPASPSAAAAQDLARYTQPGAQGWQDITQNQQYMDLLRRLSANQYGI
jgi:hypothetical protein